MSIPETTSNKTRNPLSSPPLKMQSWTDKEKFKYETWRTIAFAVVGTVCLMLIVKPIEKLVDYKAAIAAERLKIQAKVVDDFLIAAHNYTAVGYDACMGQVKDLSTLKDTVVDAFDSTRRRISVYFQDTAELKDLLTQVEGLRGEFWAECRVGSSNKTRWEPIRVKLEKTNYELGTVALKSIGL
ncbi:hypothetical protein [Accumulibacter sp.]|uniref:hypothetical protein n=1 Tax=Accumulibacter sp. TaxID=2053492 RepID=UPI0028C4164A|nr:hypothetical protein [Accumulibacter sp.]